MKNLDDLINQYIEKKRLEKVTVKILKQVLKYRLDGFTLESIAQHFKLSKSRIAALERGFVNEQDRDLKSEYRKSVKNMKQARDRIR